jgi:hypothetical protein
MDRFFREIRVTGMNESEVYRWFFEGDGKIVTDEESRFVFLVTGLRDYANYQRDNILPKWYILDTNDFEQEPVTHDKVLVELKFFSMSPGGLVIRFEGRDRSDTEELEMFVDNVLIRHLQRSGIKVEKTSAPQSQYSTPVFSSELPKKEITRAEWRKIWKVIKRTKNRFKKSYEGGGTANPSPSIDDYADAIAARLNIKRSDKTIRKIKALGESGLLD